MSERIVARVTGPGASSATPPAAQRLTDRDGQVLKLIGQGLETRGIAEQLGLSVKTNETYHSRIKEKLGLRSGRELVRAVEWSKS